MNINKSNQTDSLSVDYIKGIFIELNNKIQSLHEYSYKDFYALNDSFKNNYQASTKIFKNSKLLINILKSMNSLIQTS